MITFVGVLEIFTTFLLIFFLVCQFAMALADDFLMDLNKFNRQTLYTRKQQQEIHRQLNEMDEFHSNMMQLSY